MLHALSFLFSQSADLPTLQDVENKVRLLPGVELRSEMVSPSVVPVHFKMSRQQRFWAKYPTSEQFTSKDGTITWMPDRREYAESKERSGNPLPVGFDALWGGPSTYKQVGGTTEATFHGFKCFQIPCQVTEAYTIQLFVEMDTLLPRGTRVEYKGQTHEIVHKTINIRPMDEQWMVFRRPVDARPAGKFDPLTSLIKPGTSLKNFKAVDTQGSKVELSRLLGKHSGLVVNFWFSSCTGCIAEMPYLVKLHPKLKAANIGMIGVNAVDGSQFASRTAKKNSLPYPTLVGPGATSITKQVSVQAYPVTLVVGKNGVVKDAIMGFDEARLTKALSQIGFDSSK